MMQVLMSGESRRFKKFAKSLDPHFELEQFGRIWFDDLFIIFHCSFAVLPATFRTKAFIFRINAVEDVVPGFDEESAMIRSVH